MKKSGAILWNPKKQTACLPADYVMHQKDNEAVV